MKNLIARWKYVLLFVTFQFTLSNGQPDSIFPVPENLKDNVRFWVLIYTEISTNEGLIHDREYPLVIYRRVNTRSLDGRKLDRFLEIPKYELKIAIRNVRTAPRSQWGKLEREIYESFKNLPAGALDSAEDRIRFQQGQKENFIEGLERSGAYIDSIKSIFSQYGLPEKLAFLPHVESSFNPEAFSKAGAAGIWQFMPQTAKGFLKVNRIYDERRDPILSTFAAARLLSKNYRILRSWPLTITSYNYGINGILRAVESCGTKDLGVIIEKHESPIFRFASKNFYSCFLAASEVAQNYEKYFSIINFDQPVSIREVTLLSQMTVSDICQSLGISEKYFLKLNPSIRPKALKARHRIPVGATIRIDKSLSPHLLKTRFKISNRTEISNPVIVPENSNELKNESSKSESEY
jgi:membrane-bound lytic murein transglycosylase D